MEKIKTQNLENKNRKLVATCERIVFTKMNLELDDFVHNAPIPFGKHRNKTLIVIYEEDPEYLKFICGQSWKGDDKNKFSWIPEKFPEFSDASKKYLKAIDKKSKSKKNKNNSLFVTKRQIHSLNENEDDTGSDTDKMELDEYQTPTKKQKNIPTKKISAFFAKSPQTGNHTTRNNKNNHNALNSQKCILNEANASNNFEDLFQTCCLIAKEVADLLANGNSEATYEQAMVNALYDRRIPYKRQVQYSQCVQGHMLNTGILDLEVDHNLLLELKAGHDKIKDEHKTQLMRYLHCKRENWPSNRKDEELIAAIILFSKSGEVHVWRA